jgi:hypothetical protein
MFFDRQGQPMTAQQYEATFSTDPDEHDRYRRVGQDIVVVNGEPCNVSTVWVGIDMGYGFGLPGHAPIIFETMVFGGPYSEECTRYATELEAQEGHARVVADLMADLAPWWRRDHMADVDEENP